MKNRNLFSFLAMLAVMLLYFAIGFTWLGKASTALSEWGTAGSQSESGFIAVHAVSTAAFYIIIAVITMTRQEPVWRQRRIIGWILPISVVVTTSLVGAGESRELPYVLTIISSVIVLVGTVFTLYSLRHLGRNFGVISDVRGLVTSGPYRWVRHPLYAGEAITMIGLVIAVMSPLTATAFIVSMGLQIWRAKVEEHALSAAFPEYREYAARTPMLIPLTKLQFPRIANA